LLNWFTIWAREYAKRQKAKRALLLAGRDAAPELLKAQATTDNAEVLEHVNKLIDKILWPKDDATAEKALGRVAELAKARKIDRVIETFVLYRDYLAADEFRFYDKYAPQNLKLANELADQKGNEKKISFALPRVDFKITVGRNLRMASSGMMIVERFEVTRNLLSSLCVDSNFSFYRPTAPPAYASNSVIFCNSASNPAEILFSFVFANGDLNLTNGDRRDPGQVLGSIVFCSGRVETTSIINSVVIAKGKINIHSTRKEAQGSFVQAEDPSWGTRFALLDDEAWGVETDEKKTPLTILNVAAPKPFMKSGLQKGDVILSVNGVKAETAAEVRHVLVRASLVAPTAYVTVSLSRNVQIVLLQIPDSSR
jgi:hypothetical protein